jgi:hypothetical protein
MKTFQLSLHPSPAEEAEAADPARPPSGALRLMSWRSAPVWDGMRRSTME